MSKQESLMPCSVNFQELECSLSNLNCSNHCNWGVVLRSGVLDI